MKVFCNLYIINFVFCERTKTGIFCSIILMSINLHFILNQSMSLKWISCSQHIFGCFLSHYANLCLLTGVFKLFMLKIIIVILWLNSVILLLGFCLSCLSFLWAIWTYLGGMGFFYWSLARIGWVLSRRFFFPVVTPSNDLARRNRFFLEFKNLCCFFAYSR